jgi:hypothetical protein
MGKSIVHLNEVHFAVSFIIQPSNPKSKKLKNDGIAIKNNAVSPTFQESDKGFFSLTFLISEFLYVSKLIFLFFHFLLLDIYFLNKLFNIN